MKDPGNEADFASPKPASDFYRYGFSFEVRRDNFFRVTKRGIMQKTLLFILYKILLIFHVLCSNNKNSIEQ